MGSTRHGSAGRCRRPSARHGATSSASIRRPARCGALRQVCRRAHGPAQARHGGGRPRPRRRPRDAQSMLKPARGRADRRADVARGGVARRGAVRERNFAPMGKDGATAEITNDVIITAAALLATYGVPCLAISRCRRLSSTTHAPHQPAYHGGLARLQVRGRARGNAAHQEVMGNNVYRTSLAGQETGRDAAVRIRDRGR